VTGLAVILEAIARLAALGLGGWLAYTEATGTYEYYLEQAGGVVTFLVRGTVGITLATVILPYFMSRSIKQRRFMRAFNILAAFLLCVSVILTAGVSRTGSSQDTAKAKQAQEKRQLELATANVKTAEDALSTDKMLVAGECKTGVGKECKGLARESKGTLDTTIRLREKAGGVKEPVEDGTPKRLSLLTGGILSAQQVETIQPLLMPVTLSFVAGLLITLALDHDLPMPAPKDRKPWRVNWQWRWRKPDLASKSTYPTNVSPKAEIIDISPEPEPVRPRVPERPRPKLAVATRQPIGAVLDFLHDGLEITVDPRTEMAEAFIGYTAWCKARSLRPMGVVEFVDEMEALCKQFGIRITAEGDRHYLVGVQLAASKEVTHG
jgi:hypothetical protein